MNTSHLIVCIALTTSFAAACASTPASGPTPAPAHPPVAAWLGDWASTSVRWRSQCDDPSYDAQGDDEVSVTIADLGAGQLDVYATSPEDPARIEREGADYASRWYATLAGRVAEIVETIDEGDPNAFFAHDDLRLDMQRDGRFALGPAGELTADFDITYTVTEVGVCREHVHAVFARASRPAQAALSGTPTP